MKYAIIIFLYCFGIVFLMPAQGTKQTMSLTDLYALADSQSKTIKIFETAVSYAEQEISVARNAYLPNIDFSASASYNGNAWVSDRDFTTGRISYRRISAIILLSRLHRSSSPEARFTIP